MAVKNKASLRSRIGQLLDSNPNLTADQAIETLKGEGLGDADRIRKNYHNTKSERKKAAAQRAPSAARSRPAPSQAKTASEGKPAAAPPASEAVRQLEEVIRRCGGIDAVRQLLDVLERIGTR